ncbi:MAG: hypothetical protein ACPG4N_10680, partial [Gammaproteobacteria bacterium]
MLINLIGCGHEAISGVDDDRGRKAPVSGLCCRAVFSTLFSPQNMISESYQPGTVEAEAQEYWETHQTF